MVIPESSFSQADYHKTIFDPIKKAIKPYDKDKILDKHFLNSRGAIARFDCNAIEIRLMDIQECPKADIAICSLVIAVLKALVNTEFCSLETQKQWSREDLFLIFDAAIKDAEQTQIYNQLYLNVFGLKDPSTINKVWKHLYKAVKSDIHPSHYEAIELILEQGTLATRMLKAVGDDTSKARIISVYQELQACLQNNSMFQP